MEAIRASAARAAVLSLLALILLLLGAGTAEAGISGPCPSNENFAIIEGTRYTPANDTADDPVVLPAGETLQIEYTGTTTAAITDHQGEIAIDIGPAGYVVETWGNPNKPRPKMTKAGTYTLEVPNVVGIFDVSGFHSGTGGRCDGFAVVKIEGNPLTTPVGAGAVGGTALAAAGVGWAAVATKRGLA